MNNVYLGGFTRKSYTDKNFCLIKYSSMGVQQWNRSWGGNEEEKCMGIAIDSSDNIYLMKSRHYKSVQGVGETSHRIEIHISKGAPERDDTYEIFLTKDDLIGLNNQTWGNVYDSLSKNEIWRCMAKKHPDDPFWTK